MTAAKLFCQLFICLAIMIGSEGCSTNTEQSSEFKIAKEFRGVTWGTSAKKYSFLVPEKEPVGFLGDINSQVKRVEYFARRLWGKSYQSSNEVNKLGSVSLNGVYYIFTHTDKFYLVEIKFDNYSTYSTLKLLEERYGEFEKYSESGKFDWYKMIDDVRISLGKGSLEYRYEPLLKDVKEVMGEALKYQESKKQEY